LLLETFQEIQDTKKIIAVTKEKKWWEFWKWMFLYISKKTFRL
jgi:hypothetical protein